MTSAERAKTTVEQQARLIVENLRGRQDGWDWAVHIIAAAITQAQNDKLEEAARLMERVMADSKAALIRTLKTED